MIKYFFTTLLLVVTISFSSCSNNGLITTQTPNRPSGQEDMLEYAAPPLDTVRIGFIGLGMRGPGAVYRMAQIEGTKIVALCDLNEEGVKKAQNYLERCGRPMADEYFGDSEAWKKVCERDDIDLIYIATDWKTHAMMGVYAMENGKHVAIEVPAAMNMQEIWDLINTSERTRKHCIQLENCVYDFFELTSLNMAQKGLFGEVLHAQGAYIHNLDEFWGEYWDSWRIKYNKDHRGDVYPTHGIGPVCQVLNIHRGDRLTHLVSMDTKAVNGPKAWEKYHGPLAEGEVYQNGDHTSTLISTAKGKTILIEHNVVTPRPYDRKYQLTGTKGFANKYPIEGYMVDLSMIASKTKEEESKVVDFENLNSHNFVPKEIKEYLMEEYKHPITKDLEERAKEVGGHGGMDFIMDYRLIYCLRNGLPLDMDVYDLAEWCCLTELSAISIKNGNRPVEIPDFTRGSWDKVQGYRHAFIK